MSYLEITYSLRLYFGNNNLHKKKVYFIKIFEIKTSTLYTTLNTSNAHLHLE